MAETMQHNEYFHNSLIIKPEWNPDSFEFETALSESQKDKGVKRQDDYDGKKVFDYTDKKGREWEIVIGKTGPDSYSVRVKKKGADGQRYTQKNGEKNEFEIRASKSKKFNVELGKILDKTIGFDNRDSIPNTGSKVFQDLNKKPITVQQSPEGRKDQKEKPEEKTNLKEKPIDLQYNEINEEKQPSANLCNRETVEGRVQRCLRWTSITDAVEDRYGIPRGLLLAIAAQESYGDPTVINAGGDGGAGLLHIQATYARQYGLNVAKMTTSGSVDKGHSKELNNIKTQNNNDLKILSEYDERFNILEAVDVSARFLIGEYVNVNKSIPDNASMETWLKVASWYNSPYNTKNNWPTSYSKKVLYYWSVMNQVRGIKKPSGFEHKDLKGISEGTVEFNVNGDGNKNIKHTVTEDVKRTKEAIKNMDTSINGESVTVKNYYKYWAGQCDNYGLQEYINYNKEHPYKK